MRHNGFIQSLLLLGITAASPAALSASGLTVANLQQRIAGGEKLTVIDIRSPALFTRSHIPGAINIPASLCTPKRLPALGKVVVCGAGLGRDDTTAAVTALASKPGITVEVLEGGFAAWQSAQAPTSRMPGLEPEAPNYITYNELRAAKPEEIILLDLRKQPSAAKNQASGNTPGARTEPLTDLAREFPGLRLSRVPPDSVPLPKSAKTASITPPLLVLIDNGDGAAEALARSLKANGTQRYVILAGGEEILSRHGQPGMRRNSPGSVPLRTAPPSATSRP